MIVYVISAADGAVPQWEFTVVKKEGLKMREITDEVKKGHNRQGRSGGYGVRRNFGAGS